MNLVTILNKYGQRETRAKQTWSIHTPHFHTWSINNKTFMITARLDTEVSFVLSCWLVCWFFSPSNLGVRWGKIFGFALVSVLVCDNLWFILCDIPSPGSHGSASTCTKWFRDLIAPPPWAPGSRRRWRWRCCCCRCWLWRGGWGFRFGLNWRQERWGERISGEHPGHLPGNIYNNLLKKWLKDPRFLSLCHKEPVKGKKCP